MVDKARATRFEIDDSLLLGHINQTTLSIVLGNVLQVLQFVCYSFLHFFVEE